MPMSLEHLKVLDLTIHLSGPYCAMVLADHGADVVKVENPDGGDDMRRTPPFVGGESAPFMLWNRNKRSVTLDLKSSGRSGDLQVDGHDRGRRHRELQAGHRQAARNRLRRPVRSQPPADLLLHLGIRPDRPVFLPRRVRPHRGGHVRADEHQRTGRRTSVPRIPIPITDLVGGLNGAIGILAALAARERTGLGQHVDTSLFEAGLSLGVYEAAGVFATGEVPERLGQGHRGSAPYQLFPTADGYINIGCANDRFWELTCEVLGCPHLTAERRFATKPDRVRNIAALVEALTPYFERETTAHWCAKLDAAGVPAGPVMNHVDALSDPHSLARGMVREIEHPSVGRMKTLGVPVKLSRTGGAVRRPAPMLGEHTGEVVAEWLGADARSLAASGD